MPTACTAEIPMATEEAYEIPRETDNAVAEIAGTTNEASVTTEMSSEVSMAAEEDNEIPMETDNTVAEISGATSEIPVTAMMSSDISMVTYDTIVKIFTATLKAAVYSEIFTEAEETKEVSQMKFSSVSLDR